MRRRRKHRPHANHERWLVSYADFITLLFAFFVVLYASSQVDKKKVGKLAMAIQVAFQEMGVFETSSAKVPVDLEDPMPFDNVETVESLQRNASLAQVASRPSPALGGGGGENGDLADLQHELESTLALEISRQEISMRREPDGLVISLREVGFFESGSGAMKQESQAAFDRIAELLLKRHCRLRIEGHTDNVPIHTSRFSSNWELSTARATEIIRLLIVRDGFDPRNLGAAGYGQYHPVASNNTKEGQSMNRRVDIVILGGTSPASPAVFGPPRDPAAPTLGGVPALRPSQ
ncbi:MAG TPA: flagellar motor protein MotB [Terriglobales bacterium]|jgi:chemotaxis protein MotB|nr:flagellar motor protein MotB [Terriglobales bacterium]